MSNIDVFVFQRYDFGSGLMFFFPHDRWEDDWMNEIAQIPHVLSIKQHDSGRFMQVYAAPIPEDLFLGYARMLASNVSRICGDDFTVETIIEPDYLSVADLEEEDARNQPAEETEPSWTDEEPEPELQEVEEEEELAPVPPPRPRDLSTTSTFVFKMEGGKAQRLT